MAHTGRNRKRLMKLWLENPNCYYCGKPTVLVQVAPKQNMPLRFSNFPLRATLEHLRSKLHKKRREPNHTSEARTVLACNQCNNQQSQKEVANLGIEEVHRRSGKYKAVNIIERYEQGKITKHEAINSIFEHITKQELDRLPEEWLTCLREHVASFPKEDDVWATWVQVSNVESLSSDERRDFCKERVRLLRKWTK